MADGGEIDFEFDLADDGAPSEGEDPRMPATPSTLPVPQSPAPSLLSVKPEGSEVEWMWTLQKQYEPPHPDKATRADLRAVAMAMLDSKPIKLCSKVTCRCPKAGKQQWCTMHRKVYENAKADADRQGTAESFAQLQAKSADMCEFMDAYVLSVGLPGQRLGKAAGNFEWQQFLSERFAESSVTNSDFWVRMDHVAFIKHQTVDRLKSRSKAEAEWAEAIADHVKFPDRDFEGPGECPDTLGCRKPECAGGKLRLQIYLESKVSANATKGRSHRSLVGTKHRRTFSADHVMAADKLLEYGHEQFAGSEYASFGRSVVSARNPFAKQADGETDFVDLTSAANATEGSEKKKAKRGGGGVVGGSVAAHAAAASPSSGSGGGGGGGFGLPGGSPAKPQSLVESIEDAHTKAEIDVRRCLSAFSTILTSGETILSTVPDEPHIVRLRAALKLRLEAGNFWFASAEFRKRWHQNLPSETRDTVEEAVGVDGALGPKAVEVFATHTRKAMKDLTESLVASDLGDVMSRSMLEEQATKFGTGSGSLEVFEQRRAEFSQHVEKVKEFSRLIQKAAQRLSSTHASELKHRDVMEAKRQAEEDKKRQAEVQKEACKLNKRRKTQQSVTAEAVVAVAQQASEAAAALSAKDLWKIDFTSLGHPPLAQVERRLDPKSMNWDEPCLVVGFAGPDPTPADLEKFLFPEPHTAYKSVLSAFRGGFPKAVHKAKDGRMGYKLPEAGQYAVFLHKTAGLDSIVRPPADATSDKHKTAVDELEKTVQPHLFGYNANMRFAGCDPRQLSTLKIQISGERMVTLISFDSMCDFLRKQGAGKAITYSGIRNYLAGMSAEVARQLGEAGVSVIHGIVKPNTALFVPAGYLTCEAATHTNFGVRVSMCADFGTTHRVPAQNLATISTILNEGIVKDTLEAHLAAVIARQAQAFLEDLGDGDVSPLAAAKDPPAAAPAASAAAAAAAAAAASASSSSASVAAVPLVGELGREGDGAGELGRDGDGVRGDGDNDGDGDGDIAGEAVGGRKPTPSAAKSRAKR